MSSCVLGTKHEAYYRRFHFVYIGLPQGIGLPVLANPTE